jgi:hypothetical protein
MKYQYLHFHVYKDLQNVKSNRRLALPGVGRELESNQISQSLQALKCFLST